MGPCTLPGAPPPVRASSALPLIILLSWRTRWLPSVAASPSVGKNHKKIQRIDFSCDTRKSGFWEIPFGLWIQISSHQTVGIDLLGFDSLLCCDLLDVFLGFLQPMERRKRPARLNIIRQLKEVHNETSANQLGTKCNQIKYKASHPCTLVNLFIRARHLNIFLGHHRAMQCPPSHTNTHSLIHSGVCGQWKPFKWEWAENDSSLMR